MPYLIDTDVLIDHLADSPQASQLLDKLAPEGIAMSIITYIKEPGQVRAKVNDLRRLHTIDSHAPAIQKQIAELLKRKDNILKMAEIAQDDDTIATLQGRLSALEKERRELYSLLVDETEREEINKKIIEEIERFERWVTEVAPILGDTDYEPSMEERRLACRILGIRAYVHPAGTKKRITVDIAPPAIMKALKPLLKGVEEEVHYDRPFL